MPSWKYFYFLRIHIIYLKLLSLNIQQTSFQFKKKQSFYCSEITNQEIRWLKQAKFAIDRVVVKNKTSLCWLQYWISHYSYNYQGIPLQSSKLTSILKMRKRNITHSNYEHCCICVPIDNQIISITDSLYQRIQKEIVDAKKDSAQLQCSKLEPLDFTRLIKIIFNKRFKSLKTTATCKHNELKKSFINRLECSSRDIDRASSTICWKVAKLNFHTDIVILQSKSFLRHLIQPKEQRSTSLSVEADKKVSVENKKPIKQQNFQRSPDEVIIENSINLSRLSLVDKMPNVGLDQYAYIWPFSWQNTPLVFTNCQFMNKQIEKNNQIVTCTKFQQQ